MTPLLPFTITLLLVDGMAEGLTIIEKSNWSGCGIRVPRAYFAKHKNRPEFQKLGVYLLVGDLEFEPKIYIGEGDPMLNRIQSHDQTKDFWDLLIAFTSKDLNLNKANIQYLEASLVQLARKSGQFLLVNGNDPKPPSLSEMDKTICDGYLREVLLCLPVLGVILGSAKPSSLSSTRFFINAKNVKAFGINSPEGFQVFEGSEATESETPSIPAGIKARRRELIERGVLKKTEKGHLIFCKDHLFSSPFTASAIVLGRSSNGWIDWRDLNNCALKDVVGSA